MNIPQAIMHLYPQANPLKDFIVQDDSDGNGPYIAQWSLKDANGQDVAKPTAEQLQAAWDAMQPTPDQLLSQAKQAKIDDLNAACNAAILSGFTSDALGTPNTYDFGYDDQINLGGMLNAVSAGIVTDSITWKASGVPQPHTVAQFKAVFAAGLAWKNTNIGKYWTLKAQVAAATTSDAIGAITW